MKLKKLKPNKNLGQIILKFEPTTNFEEEFLEFVETVLAWGKEEKPIVSKPEKMEKSKMNYVNHYGSKRG